MDKNVRRVVLFSALGYSAYVVATCPCEAMGYCKRQEFLLAASIPFAFALYNFVGGATCSSTSV
jgi:hypothetical protein